jgi:hypothetical protein
MYPFPSLAVQRKRCRLLPMALRRSKTELRTTPPIPPAASELAARLCQLQGVVCAVWGSRRKSGRWRHDQKCLSIHVVKKLTERQAKASGRMLEPVIDGIRIDVLQVGKTTAHSLDVKARLNAGPLGLSTPTALARRGKNAVALLSGHGALDTEQVTIGGFSGDVTGGRFGGGASVDFALADFIGAGASVVTKHPVTDEPTPIPLASDLDSGDRVMQFSGKRGRSFVGILQGPIDGNVKIGGHLFTGLLSIAPATSASFSVDGDSGSLVVDEAGRAVGAVVGRASESVYYAYDVARLASILSKSTFELFFKE